MIAPSATRVTSHTDPAVNARLAEETAARLAWLEAHPERIPDRLAALDAEWDVERTLELNSALLSLAGVVGALATRRRGWLALALAVQGFFLQHAVQGWCPPLPVLRRLGFRTATEIERERCALRGMLDDRVVH